MGWDYRRTQFNINQPGGPRGSFTFDGVFTRLPKAPAGTGSGPADLLLGYADSASISNSVTIGVRIHAVSAFLQDDWKVNNRLTLNRGFGMRTSLLRSRSETGNSASTTRPLRWCLRRTGPGSTGHSLIDKTSTSLRVWALHIN
jgi:hypothetical protein